MHCESMYAQDKCSGRTFRESIDQVFPAEPEKNVLPVGIFRDACQTLRNRNAIKKYCNQ